MTVIRRSRASAYATWLSVLLSFLTSFVAHADREGDYTYVIANGRATVTAFDASYSGALSVTNTLGDCPVTAIGDEAFEGCSGLNAILFQGNAPTLDGEYVFAKAPPTVYYLPGTFG